MKVGTQITKAYLDANVLVSYQVGRDKEPGHYPLAEEVFKNIITGKYSGIISLLTVMETINVFRRIKTEELKQLTITEPAEQIEYVKNESNFLYNDLTRKLLESHKTIKFEDCRGIAFSNFLPTCLEIAQQYHGKVKTYNNCRQCKSNVTHNVHKAIGPLDILHIFLALALGCKYFITFDKGFLDIVNDSRMKNLEIKVME